MDGFEETEMEQMIRSSVRKLVQDYDEEYWREIRKNDRFPKEVWDDLSDNGWMGVAIPEEYGGQGMGMKELAVVIEEVGAAGGWPLTLKFVLSPLFGGETLVAHGSEEQKERWLPDIAAGDARWALGVTEPDSGLNTRSISTTAEKDGDEYVIDGKKIWCSGAASADRITVLARTLSPEEADGSNHGLTVFLVDPDDPNVDYDQIPLDNYFPDDTYNLYLDGVRVHEDDIVGTEHEGLYDLFDLLNTERIATAACAAGTGRYALEKATEYANDREVFDAPIGTHQGVAHPLAEAHINLEAGRLMNRKASWLYDEGETAGTEANIANYLCCHAGWEACEAAHVSFGGMSLSEGTGISAMTSYLRHLRIAPVSEEMILNYVAEQELGLPRSY
jgi:acyl-CoA dehydrogenase